MEAIEVNEITKDLREVEEKIRNRLAHEVIFNYI